MSTPDTAPRLSVVIVTWNCAALLRDCLASLRRHAGTLSYELVIVDNASADQTLEVVAQDWPEARVIANTTNTGFATACNQGMDAARAELIFLLNPDTLLAQPDTLQRLCERMDAHPQIAMAGARLVFPDGRYQVGDAGHCPTLRAVVWHAMFLSRLCQRCFPGLMIQGQKLRPPYARVGWVCGGSTVVRRSALQVGGPLDQSYFMYGEDIEWGCRFNRAGLLVAYLPDIEIIHVQSGTQKNIDPLAPIPTRWIDGVSGLFVRHGGGRRFGCFKAAMTLGFLLRGSMYWVAERLGVGTPTVPARSRTMYTYARHTWQLARPRQAPH